MCLLCSEILKGKITFKEVSRALNEFTIPEEHVEEFDTVLKNTYTQDMMDALLKEAFDNWNKKWNPK